MATAALMLSCAGGGTGQPPSTDTTAEKPVTVLIFDFRDYSPTPGSQWMERAIADLLADDLSQARGINVVSREILRKKLAENGGTSLRAGADDALVLAEFTPEPPVRQLIDEFKADFIIQGISYVGRDGWMQIVAYVYVLDKGAFLDFSIAQPSGDPRKGFFGMIDNIAGTFGTTLPRAAKRFNLPAAARVDFNGVRKIESLLKEKLSPEKPLETGEIFDRVKESYGGK